MEINNKNSKDIYLFYKNKEKVKNKVSEKQYKKVCDSYNKSCFKSLLEEKEVWFPFGLGRLFLSKSETNWDKPPVDWKATKKLGRYVHHINNETNMFILKFKWISLNYILKNGAYYSFTATFTNRREASRDFKEAKGNKYKTYTTL